MRCNNCGWDNDPSASVCVKCGHPLQTDNAGYNDPYRGVSVPNQGEAQPRPTVLNNPQAGPGMPPQAPVMPRPTRIATGPMAQPQDMQLKRTVVQGAVQPQAAQPQPAQPQQPQQSQNCPQCGYPVMGSATNCPNCGASIAPQQPAQQQPAPQPAIHPMAAMSKEFDIDETVKCAKCGSDVSIEFSFCPKCGERIHLPTVRAIRHKPTPAPEPVKPKCHLTLIPEEDEQTEPLRNDYEGASVILNRENTEPNNRTITSKEQAELVFEDGKWFVVNKSELESTFLEANRKLELQEGDVIVLGDRRFKFEAEKL